MDYFECLRLIKGFEKKDDKGKNKFLTYDEANNILRAVKSKIKDNILIVDDIKEINI